MIQIILGSYLQFGGTVSRVWGADVSGNPSWFIHSHFSVSIAPHGTAHALFQTSLLFLLALGAFARGGY